MSSSSLLRNSLIALEVETSDDDDDDENIRTILTTIFAEIETYKESRVDIDADLLKYWENKRFNFPHLKNIVNIIHAVPATQVSVERAFSALKLVLTDLRCNLSDKNLQTIMFLKLNKNV